jgi:hypothetical protein
MAHEFNNLIGGKWKHVPPVPGKLDRCGEQCHTRLNGWRQNGHASFMRFQLPFISHAPSDRHTKTGNACRKEGSARRSHRFGVRR